MDESLCWRRRWRVSRPPRVHDGSGADAGLGWPLSISREVPSPLSRGGRYSDLSAFAVKPRPPLLHRPPPPPSPRGPRAGVRWLARCSECGRGRALESRRRQQEQGRGAPLVVSHTLQGTHGGDGGTLRSRSGRHPVPVDSDPSTTSYSCPD